MIYETLLIHHGNLYFDPTYSLYRCDHKLYPQILATCRFLYDEAVPLLYSKNKLVVDSKRSLLKLWETIDRRSSPSSETNTLDITSLSIVGYSPLGNFLDDVQKTATKLPALRSLSIELDDVIMKYYIRHDQKSKYVERRIKLRNNLLSKFRTVTESHPLLMRIVEVCYEKDVNYRRGMHFRLLGQGVKVSSVYLTRRWLLSLTGWRTTRKSSTQPTMPSMIGWLIRWGAWLITKTRIDWRRELVGRRVLAAALGRLRSRGLDPGCRMDQSCARFSQTCFRSIYFLQEVLRLTHPVSTEGSRIYFW